MAPAPGSVAVVVPTRGRPERLERCLDALERARRAQDFRVYVCDSSSGPHKAEVVGICARREFVELVQHDLIGASAARNVGTLACSEEVVVCVDDDVYVEPGAIAELVRAYRGAGGDVVVAGSVDWGDWASRPLVMRRIGFARDARDDETPELLVSALVLYPRWLGLLCPWNERLWPIDDLFASRLWRLAGVRLRFAPDARADHDVKHSAYPVANEADRIYANLFDALFLTRSPLRLLGFEALGFAACAKHWTGRPGGLWGLTKAWIRGHWAFLADLGDLRRAARRARDHAAGHPVGAD